MTAVLSPCSTYRYRLEREVNVLLEGRVGDLYPGVTYAFFGINPSTADAAVDDATVRKLCGFTRAMRGRRLLVGNVFAFRATDVRELAAASDPVGPQNAEHLRAIAAEADVLVPCWGDRSKVPRRLHAQIDATLQLLLAQAKPVRIFGRTAGGDPKHPLMLAYSTPMVDMQAQTKGRRP